jgi:hypothetical protein
MVTSIHDDELFLSSAIHFGQLNQTVVHEEVNEIIDIIKEKVFGSYYYIDYEDLKDMISQLLRDRTNSNGFFGKEGWTMVDGKSNSKRLFNIIK